MSANLGHFDALADDECRHLLRTHTIARIGWESSAGPQILPVTYAVDGAAIVFRTSPRSVLAELRTPTRAAVQIDAVDEDTRTGWSVLARGRTSAPSAHGAADEPVPWAGADRDLLIRVDLDEVSGRIVSADE